MELFLKQIFTRILICDILADAVDFVERVEQECTGSKII